MGVREWLGIGGSSTGTPTGTFSMWKVVSGVGSVVAATSDGILTSIKTAVEKVATEVAVGDGLKVRQDTASKLVATVKQATPADLNCTEASGSTIASRLVETGPGTGTVADLLRAIAGAAGATKSLKDLADLLTNGATSAASLLDSIKTAVELIDDAIFTQDAAAGKALTAGAELVDPSSLPANGVAGKVRRLIANLKGMLFVTMGTALSGENGLTGSNGRIWTQDGGTIGSGGTLTDSGTLHTGACRLIGLIITTTTAGTTEAPVKDNATTKFNVFPNAAGTQCLYIPGSPTFATSIVWTKGTSWVGSITAIVDTAV